MDLIVAFRPGAEARYKALLSELWATRGLTSRFVLEEVDLANASSVASFIRRIQALFLEGSCLKTGFTKIMMNMLKKPMTYFVRGHMLQCGSPEGVSAADAEWCLARMACYVRNAIAVVRAEFLDYILLNAFSIFNLQSDDLCSRHKNRSAIPAGGANFQEKVSTLAKTFGGGDVEKFQAQFLRVQRVAQAVATEETGADNSREAFRTAVLRMRPRTKPKSDIWHWPSGILLVGRLARGT